MNERRRALRLLFAGRFLRLVAYGALSVVLVLFLADAGLGEGRIGALLSATFVGDVVVSLWLTTRADSFGRRRTFVIGALLMAAAGAALLLTTNFGLLLLAATIGVVSPNGKEVGPFLSLEQAAVAEVTTDKRRTSVLAWYHVAGTMAGAIGALAAGLIAQVYVSAGHPASAGYRAVVIGYAFAGVLLAALATGLPHSVEIAALPPAPRPRGALLGLNTSRATVLRLAGLFAVDAFAGGFIIQSIVAFWFERRFHISPALLGSVLFAANVLAAVSAPVAARLAMRYGLVRTMVFTHLPSNALLIVVPLMPTLPLAAAVYLLRASISQMDVPTRQSLTMAVTPSPERAAAAGVTSIARSVGAIISPAIAGWLLHQPALIGVPFIAAGTIKIAYDVALYRFGRRIDNS